MILIKLLAPILLLITSLLGIGLENKWHDKRTKKHRYTVLLLISVIIIAAGFTCWTIIIEDKSSRDLNGKIDEINESIKKVRKERDDIKVQMETMNKKLDPFIERAGKQYPNLSLEDGMSKLLNDIDLLREQSKRVEKSVKETIEKINNPTLSVSSIRYEKDYTTLILLKPSNNQQIGRIQLNAKVITGNIDRIIEFSPVGVSVKVSKWISKDGKEATVEFNPFSGAEPEVMIKATGAVKILISGSHDLKPFTIEII